MTILIYCLPIFALFQNLINVEKNSEVIDFCGFWKKTVFLSDMFVEYYVVRWHYSSESEKGRELQGRSVLFKQSLIDSQMLTNFLCLTWAFIPPQGIFQPPKTLLHSVTISYCCDHICGSQPNVCVYIVVLIL